MAGLGVVIGIDPTVIPQANYPRVIGFSRSDEELTVTVALQASPYTSLATASWRRGIDLGIRTYISYEAPPGELVSSVRAVVLREDSVLTMTNLYGAHILPGGRVEEGETHDEALRREVFEEARVELAIMGRIGFMHLRHTSPKPEDYRYLYPVFIWQIWAASLVEFRPDLMVDDGCEVSFRLLSFQEIGELNLDSHRAEFLEAPLAMRKYHWTISLPSDSSVDCVALARVVSFVAMELSRVLDSPFAWAAAGFIIGLTLGVTALSAWLLAIGFGAFLLNLKLHGPAQHANEGWLFAAGPAFMMAWVFGFIVRGLVFTS